MIDIVCPYCGQMTPDDSVYCEICSKNLRNNTKQPSKKDKRPLIIPAGMMIILFSVALIWLVSRCSDSEEVFLSESY